MAGYTVVIGLCNVCGVFYLLVAGSACIGRIKGIPGRLVRRVTGVASHLASLEAFAEFQELQLHAVYIGFAGRAIEIEIKFGEGIARYETEDRIQSDGIACVTGAAHVQLLLSTKCFNGCHEFRYFGVRVFLLELHMLCGGAVAAFAVDAIYNRGAIHGLFDLQCRTHSFLFGPDIGGMAFEAAAGDHSRIIRMIDGEAGAVGPDLCGCEIREWQFE